jgi:septum site-determining protein MinC
MPADSPIVIKGTRDGLLITLGDGEWEDVLAELDQHLARTATFFQGGQVTLQVGHRSMTAEALQEVAELLESHGITLIRVLSEESATRRAAQKLGYATAPLPPRPGGSADDAGRPGRAEASNGLVVRRTLRSGQSIRHPGPVIILGDVNPGAEVVAGGDVIVWGHLRGLVHAGAWGDDEAIVCALHLAPTQLRIGSQIARPPDKADEDTGEGERRKRRLGNHVPRPEVARVVEGRIVIDAWE